MVNEQLRGLVRFLHRVTGPPAEGRATDQQLLARFARDRDEAAFATLLERHGPMVRGVCLRVLRDAEDAEDAFQAAFLVLAKKAGSVSWHESVGGWLHEVAWRIARKARSAARRDADRARRLTDEEVPDVATADPAGDAARRELRAVLDEELARLPEKYRLPLVLCYLEGQTNEEAARQLGWSKGTVSGRLARARDLLRPRLARRGLVPSAPAVGAALAEQASAAVPAPLSHATLKAAVLYAADPAAAAGRISANVISLAEGVLKSMFHSKLKVTAAVLLGVLLLGAGASAMALHALAAGRREGEPPAAAKPADKPGEARPKGKTDLEKFQGTWQLVAAEFQGKPLPEEDLEMVPRKVVIEGDDFLEYRGDFAVASILKLDPAKKPKTMDWLTRTNIVEFGVKRVEESVTNRLIYELDGETFKIAFTNDGTRPADFRTGPGSQTVVYFYKRGEPPAKPDKQKQPEFVEAEVTLHLGRDGVPDEPQKEMTKTVKDKATLARFVSCFPEMGRGRESDIFGGWVPRMTFKFRGSKGETVTVSSIWTNWSEGKGDWLVKANLMKYAGELFEVPRLADQGNFLDDWEVVSIEEGGKRRDVKGREVAFSEDTFGIYAGDETEWEADYYTLSPEKTPKEIALYTEFYTRDKKEHLGIYAIEGDTLKICFDKGGKGRPSEFTTTPDRPGEMLVVLKRVPAARGGEGLAEPDPPK